MAVLNKLSVKEVEAICKQKKVGKHADGGGLYLHVTEAGGCYWRYKYRIDGKEKLAAFGTFPEVSLGKARDKHLAARNHVEANLDPLDEKRKDKIAKEVERAAYRPFREVAQEWSDAMIPASASYSTKDRAQRDVRNLCEVFGSKAIIDVTVADLAIVLKKQDAAGKYATRERTQLAAIKIAGFAVGRGYLKHNPFRDVKFADSFISPSTVYEARPALVKVEPFGKLLRDIERAHCETEISRITLRLMTLLAVRPGELAKSEWAHFQGILPGDKREPKMIVPPEVSKQRTQRKKVKDPRAGKDFEVPLSRQAVAELRRLHALTGHKKYLLPARYTKVTRNPHIRTATINGILLRLGYQNEHCAHGFRSSFSTIMNAERVVVEGRKALRWPYQDAIIEVQLDHNDASTKGVYDRGGHWEDRCELMQLWADRIDEMRAHGGSTKLRIAA